MNENRLPRESRHLGFTLIELMAAITVLALISIVVAQMISSSSLIAIGARKRLDAEEQARLVLGRMGEDFSRMLVRSDLDYIFSCATGNDAFFFYSEAPASFSSGTAISDKGSVALVGYRINIKNGSGNFNKLERLGKGLKWSGGTASQTDSPVFLIKDSTGAFVGGSLLSSAWVSAVGTEAQHFRDGTDSSFQIFSDGVIRMEIAFLKRETQPDGTVKTFFTQDPQATGNGTTRSLTNVAAVVVTLAILDEASQKLIDASKISQIVAALPDPVSTDFSSNPPVLMATKWMRLINNGTISSSTGIPQAVASQIRIYQRVFALNKK